MTCKHPHGAVVPSLAPWVCGRCYARLQERPRRYGMVPRPCTTAGGPRQEIVWQAEVRTSAEGVTLSGFLRTMAKRFQARDQMPDATALRLAVEWLEAVGAEFGDPDYAWDHVAAREHADEAMAEWEDARSGTN